MKKTLLFALCFALSLIAWSQPELDNWIMSTGFAQYTTGGPTITMSDSGDVQEVCYTNMDVFVRATGLPGTYVMGSFPMNPNTPAGQTYVARIDRTPTEELGTKTSVPLVGGVGIALNGVVFYGYGDARSYETATGQNTGNGDGNWFSDAWVSEGATMDATGNGHPQQQGVYHYHANPIALYNDPSTSHSPIIGFAWDGFPIYGPFGYTSPMNSSSGISRMVSGYELRNISDRTVLPGGSPSVPAGPAINTQFPLGTYIEDYEFTGNGDLDEYNGRMCVTPEYPGGTYAYFLSTDGNGDPKFPYIFAAEYYGEVTTTSTNNNIPPTATCGVSTSVETIVSFRDEIKLYPNPSSNSITIDLGEIEATDLLIMNGIGQIVHQGVQQHLDVSAWPQGIYNVSVVVNNTVETIRFLKQ